MRTTSTPCRCHSATRRSASAPPTSRMRSSATPTSVPGGVRGGGAGGRQHGGQQRGEDEAEAQAHGPRNAAPPTIGAGKAIHRRAPGVSALHRGHRRPPASRSPCPRRCCACAPTSSCSALFRAGREEAFRVLHDRYHERLLAYVRHMLRGHSEAEDIVQDVFERAYGALRAGERDIAVRPWLYRVAHNRCIDYVRRAPATPLQPDELLPGGIDPVARRRAARGPAAPRRRPPRAARAAALGADHPRARGALLRRPRDDARGHRARRQVAARARPQRARRGGRGARHRLRRDPRRARARRRPPGPAAAAAARPPAPVLLAAARTARRCATATRSSRASSPARRRCCSAAGSPRCSAPAAAPASAAAGSSLAAGATKAMAVASASFAVAGGAAEVADHAHVQGRHAHTATAAAVSQQRAHPTPSPPPPQRGRAAPLGGRPWDGRTRCR